MAERTLISVVIPSYNRADTVGQTIESIVAQKVDADVEIVIGDDCSTDNARDILEQYRQKYPDIIRIFFREENMGLGANWAQCVKDCHGEFICNCDNDDYWHNPNKLQLQLDYMRSHPQCNICVTNHRTLNRKTGEIHEYNAEIDHADIQRAMFGRNRFSNATIMYRASFMKEHLDLDEFIRRRFSLQDWPTWVILTAYTDIDVLPVSTATMGVETASLTRPESIEDLAKRLEADVAICRYFGELFPEMFPFTEPDKDDPWINGRLMAKAFELNDYKAAKKYGKKSTGVGRIKRLCSQNYMLFQLYRLLKRIRKACSKN